MADANATTQIPLAGARVRRTQRRAALIAGGALAVGLGAIAVATLRPLPSPQADEELSIPDAPVARALSDALEHRQQRLAALAQAGNVFAPDRLAWKNGEASVQNEEVVEEPQAPSATPPVAHGAAQPVITLTERPTAAAKKSRDSLDLLGIFASGEKRFAMIRGGEADRRKDVELYREDDVFFADTWRVLRIVEESDYVILEHLGQGDIVALSMYATEIPSVAAAAPAASGPAIATATAEEAGAQMLEAGIAESDVNEVLDLLGALERGEDITPTEEEAVAAAEKPAPDAQQEPRKPGAAPEMPPALAGLLRSMAMDARKSRESQDEDKSDEDAPSPN